MITNSKQHNINPKHPKASNPLIDEHIRNNLIINASILININHNKIYHPLH